jgi:ABC-type amino acid transport substrate-binding protein
MNRLVAALLAAVVLAGPAWGLDGDCDVPAYLLAGDSELPRVAAIANQQHRISVDVIGTGSSLLSGPAGPDSAYPGRLEAALKEKFPRLEVKIKSYARGRQTAGDMLKDLDKILAADKPDLVIWQTGTIDAMRGVEPEEFRTVLDEGVEALQSGGADVILMNMQYSPRTESVIALGPYNDNMHWVSQQRGVPLFDRLAIMRYWSEQGTFDLYAATKDQAMARRVHDCIGRGLASLIVEVAHLETEQAKAPH